MQTVILTREDFGASLHPRLFDDICEQFKHPCRFDRRNRTARRVGQFRRMDSVPGRIMIFRICATFIFVGGGGFGYWVHNPGWQMWAFLAMAFVAMKAYLATQPE